MEYKKEQFNEKVLTNHITKEQWIDILKNSNLIGLRDMKILLNLYGSNGQPLKTSLIGVPQTFKYFNKMQERINDFIIRTSGIKLDVLKKMMMQTDELLNDMGTILVGEEAVKCGLINEVGGVKEALDKLNSLIEAYNVEP